ncbi:MAG: efflux RND transporter permease subunit [Chitinophagales bacterium]
MSNSSEKNDSQNQIVREFGLSSLAVDNKTSVFVIIFLIVLLGWGSYVTMPKESFPEIVLPTIYVGTPYPGNSPLDMETLVSRPIEKELNTITGVKKIEATCIQDYSTIVVEFDLDMPASEALLDVKDAVDRAKPDLPNDLPADPNIFEMDFSNMPILNVNVTGVDNIDKLNEYAEYLQEEFEKLSEISAADIRGVPEKEVSISVDNYKLEARKLSFRDIEDAVSYENATISGGDILSDGVRRNVRIVGEFANIDDMLDIIISNQGGNIVYLRDVATVNFGYADRTSYARSNTMPVVMLDIKKRSGENLLEAISKIKDIVTEAKKSKLPKEIKVQLLNDQSKMTRSMLANLNNSIVAGVILVVLVLQFFLGMRNALFVGVAIPLSMFMGFLILGVSGVTLNIMVLFSLILALGMLVDNGIVVVENIYRFMDEGHSPINAAKQGVGEVAWPIISSTATTLAAFLPLLFWNSIMGEFMKYLPITLIIVLASSLFVALVINPVLTSVFMKIDDPDEKTNHVKTILWSLFFIVLGVYLYTSGGDSANRRALGSLLSFFGSFTLFNTYILSPLAVLFQAYVLPLLERGYRAFVRFALTGFLPIVFFAATIALMVGSINLLTNSGLRIDLFPANEPSNVFVFIEQPIGTDIGKTNAFTQEIEKEIITALKPYESIVEAVMGQVGEGTSDPNAGPQQGSSPNKSRVTVSFLEYEFRNGLSTTDAMKAIRKAVTGYPGVQIVVAKDSNGPPTGPAVNIEISGENFATLLAQADEVRKFLNEQDVQGVEELKIDLESGKPELLIDIDRDKARRFGLSTSQIAGTMRTAIFGKEISKFKDGEDDYPIQLRFGEENRYDLPKIMNQKVTFRNNQGKLMQIPISAVADVRYASTYGSVKRKDLNRVVTIYSNVTEDANGADIVLQYKGMLSDYEMPEGYDLKFTGEQEEQQESMAFLGTAMMVAVFLIFLIIVTQFNSVAMPIIIVMSVFFSTIGVFLGYSIFRMDFIIIMTGIGIISLAGVVVNNAIVLIDYTNLVRNRQRLTLGLSDDESQTKAQVVDAIVEAGSKRLRPVLLTAITTVLGLMPLATGMNINFFTLLADFDAQIYFGGDNAIFWGPMAWTVIFGLTFATFLTLVIIPVMYLMMDRISSFAFDKRKKTTKTKEEVELTI